MSSLKTKKINKVLEIKLLKNKIFRFNRKKSFSNTKATIKTNLKLIFKYKMLNKTIFILGNNKKLNSFLLKLTRATTNFTFLPYEIWFKGALTNSELNFKYFMLAKSKIKRLTSINRKTNLILLFENNFVTNELASVRVPILSFIGFNKLCDYYVNFFKKNLGSNLFVYFLKVLNKKSKFLKSLFKK